MGKVLHHSPLQSLPQTTPPPPRLLPITPPISHPHSSLPLPLDLAGNLPCPSPKKGLRCHVAHGTQPHTHRSTGSWHFARWSTLPMVPLDTKLDHTSLLLLHYYLPSLGMGGQHCQAPNFPSLSP